MTNFTQLIQPDGTTVKPLPLTRYVGGPTGQPEDDQRPLALWRYLWLIGRHWLELTGLVVTFSLATFYICSKLPPIYEGVTIVDVDRQAPPAIVGTDAVRLNSNDADQFLATQVKLIQSDEVLRPVADKYHLLEQERQFDERGVDPIKLSRAPVVLNKLKVTRTPNTFLVAINYRTEDPELAANVANAIASSYLDHSYQLRIRSAARLTTFMEQQLDELRAKMERSNQALAQFERELNVINPEEKTNILSSRLLQLNSEYTTAQTDRVRKEAAFNSMKSGTLAAAQVSGQGEDLAALSERVNLAKQKLAEIAATFGRNHPEYLRASSQLAEVTRQFQELKTDVGQRVDADYRQALGREQMLQAAVATTKAETDRLNARSFEYKRVKEVAETDRKLFDELTGKISEAGVNAGFENSTIRIADTARPPAKPVSPNIPLCVTLAFLGSLIVGIAAIFTFEMADMSLRDPEQVARMLGADVVGILPMVQGARLQLPSATRDLALLPAAKLRRKERELRGSLAGFDEAVRSLRNTILLSDLEQRPRSLLMTSAFQKEGKSSTSIHLAMSNADLKRKTLLIDADMRRPVIHKRLGITMGKGLSDVLTGASTWQDVAIHVPGHAFLDLIPAGTLSHRPSDLLDTAMVGLLEQTTQEYDLVIVDAPPMLGFAEPLQIATAVDAVVVVAKAGKTSRKAVGNVLSILRRVRANALGVVLNQFETNMSATYYSYGYDSYTYRSEPPPGGSKGALLKTT